MRQRPHAIIWVTPVIYIAVLEEQKAGPTVHTVDIELGT
jgi:hypothetical protein